MIDRGHALSVTKQAEAAGIARSTVYYLPRRVSAADLELMRQIDRLHLEFPFAGARMLRGLLARCGRWTSAAFTGVLIKNEIAISMDGKGAWRDNVFVERLWRSVKYEEVYLHAYDSVPEARASIGQYLDLYNRRRPHSSLDGMTPDQAYRSAGPPGRNFRC